MERLKNLLIDVAERIATKITITPEEMMALARVIEVILLLQDYSSAEPEIK